MNKTLLAGISAAGMAVAASGSAWAFVEFKAAFVPEDPMAKHQVVATSCQQPRSFRRIKMKGGAKFARAGEVFAFEPRVIRAKRCEEVEIVLENTDKVRHALMLPGLNPMFVLEFTGRRVKSLRFVTPDEDVTLEFHCHVPTHEQMGMLGELIVGKGGKPPAHKAPPPGTARLFDGIGRVVAVEPRRNRLVLTHGAIKGFMAPMAEMSFMVTPATLLKGIEPGDNDRFTIDADKRMIVDIKPFVR
ncbi:MAG: copper-binding protein [Alphaproteobacteria bacterium]|nr:copper-binding protein [Alphaproteobacteria bacterium]